MLRYLAILLLSISSGLPLKSQDAVISGVVRDNESGETLPGVHIIISGDRGGVLSDINGIFTIKAAPGRIGLTFRFVGYSAQERLINLSPNDTVWMEISLHSEVRSINEIVVTAGKGQQRASDLSVSLTVIKPYQVSRSHIINADELLQKTTGVEITDGQASIRGGSGYSYGAGSRVLTLIDGLPALSADAGNIKWGTLPVENVSRVEVIKGASSVLYGSSALNGVINFITRESGPEPFTRISLTSGIYDKPAREEWKWWSEPRLTKNLSFTHASAHGKNEFTAGGRIMNDNGYRSLNYDRNGRLNLRYLHKSDEVAGLRYGASLLASYSNKNDFLLWEDAATGALKQSPSTAMDYRGYTLALDPTIEYAGRGSGRHSFRSRWMKNINSLPENTNNNSDSYSLFTEYQYTHDFSGNMTLSSGALYQNSLINSEFYGDHRGYNLAAYSQADIHPFNRVNAVVGVRVEQFSLDSEADKPVPLFRAGANYELSKKTFMRASFGQGYRYPSVAEKHAYTTVGSIRIFPNNEIKPEFGWSGELGLKRYISSENVGGSLDVAFFYSRNRDMIEYVFGSYRDPVTDQFEPGFRPVNIENSMVYGLETEFLLNMSRGSIDLSIAGGYTYINPVEVNSVTLKPTGEYLKYRRKHSANVSMNLQSGKFDIGLTANYRSATLAVDNVFVNEFTREQILPGFYDYWLANNKGHLVIDFNTGWRARPDFTVSGVIKNLTNCEYMGRPGDIQPQRYYSVQLSYTF